VTDANLLLGRLLPEYFPAIFGPQENLPLDIEATRKLFNAMAAQVKEETGQDMRSEEVALG
jgi:5-oxoprolinase (ATP-hydrolysing)